MKNQAVAICIFAVLVNALTVCSFAANPSHIQEQERTKVYQVQLVDTAANTMAVVPLQDSANGAADDENKYSHIESDYQIVNHVGANCDAALFLESAKEQLDYYFWLAFQTQAGLSGPADPKGFSDASEISAEGLVRLFCYLNEYQISAFSDPDERMYYIPDSIVPLSLDKVLQGYTYDPKKLPSEFGYTQVMLRMSYDLMKPAANPCRLERAEVLDTAHIKLTATGLTPKANTPRNTQELVLKVREGGGIYFESYVIKPFTGVVPPSDAGPAIDSLSVAAPDGWQQRQKRLLRNKDAVKSNIRPVPFAQKDGAYLIQTANDLVLLRTLIAEQVTFSSGVRAQLARYRLENDIDLTAVSAPSGWQPIGEMVWGGIDTEEQYLAFSGVFDGNGKTITGLTVRKTDESMFYGLFGYATLGEICNLNLKDCDVRGGGSTGAVAGGGFSAWSGDELTIRNCHVTGTVMGDTSVGGVVGVATYVENCSFEGTVESTASETGNPQMTGGIVGNGWTVRGCRAKAVVKGFESVGGLAGRLQRVQASCFFGGVAGYSTVGGLAGSTAQISGSYCAGLVAGQEAVGGLAGSAATISNIEPQTVGGVLSHSVMTGPSIAKVQKRLGEASWGGQLGRVCGKVGAGIESEALYAQKDLTLLPSGSFSKSYPYDGKSVSLAALSQPGAFQKMLETEDLKWADYWKPVQPGYYPQLLWETAAPVPIARTNNTK